MFKKAIFRGFSGIFIGVFISTTISLIISLIFGEFSFTSPQLIESMGSELNAAVLQYFLSCLIGFICAAGSVIFEIESWSITKQTVVHFFTMFLSTSVLGIGAQWVSFTPSSLLSWTIIWVVSYIGIWFAMITYWKCKIKKINKNIQKL